MCASRWLAVSLLGLLLSGMAQAQESEATDADEPAVEAAADAAADEAEDVAAAGDEDDIDLDDIEDADLDLQVYEEDDDDFVPTEEVPADQAIPFPTDI